MVSISPIPANYRVPLATFSIEPSQAIYQSDNRLLLIGHKLPAGTVALDTPVLVNDDFRQFAGQGSMLAEMFDIARSNAPFQEIWIMAVAEPAGAAATGTITVTAGTATEATTVYWYINGDRYSTSVLVGEDQDVIAMNIAAQINANADATVTASATANVVTVTARHVGETGNDIALELGRVGDEGVSSGTWLTVVGFSGGTGTTDISNGLANLSDEEFDVIAGPFNDTTTLNHVRDFLDGISGRWSASQELYGHYFTAKNDTYGNLAAFGNGRNDPHVSIMGIYNTGSPAWVWAAAIGAQAAQRFNGIGINLSIPLHATVLRGVYGPKSVADRWDKVERQSFYFDGISAYRMSKAGEVIIDRLITTYRLNDFGSSDPSWLDVNTMFQSFQSVRYLKAKVTGAFAEKALADDDPFGLDDLVTPDEIRDLLLHGYLELIAEGVVENYEVFEAALEVARSNTDANRVNATIPIDLVNQLRVFAGQVITHLQLGSFSDR